MSKISAILLGLVILTACEKDKSFYEGRTSFFDNIRYGEEAGNIITCVTYNIQLGFRAGDDPWNKTHIGGTRQHISDLKQIILKVNPDIVCLQEVPRNRYNTKIKDFIQELAKELNMNFAYGAHGYNDPYGIEPVEGEWGNAILSKFEILNMENKEIEYKSIWERRSILMANLKLNNNLNIFTYSLHHLPSDEAIPNSIDYFSEKSNSTQIIMGDFNMTQIPELESIGYIDILNVDTTVSFSIDRIFTSKDEFEVMETGEIENSSEVSDHPANYCKLKIK
ncbi:endonuclease/exonuclease/phosphatase family protein [bacterium AH-315-C07]|nr:endonuclease/exonuclease/phosphatase family protein [bacterium AH-315-C07]